MVKIPPVLRDNGTVTRPYICEVILVHCCALDTCWLCVIVNPAETQNLVTVSDVLQRLSGFFESHDSGKVRAELLTAPQSALQAIVEAVDAIPQMLAPAAFWWLEAGQSAVSTANTLTALKMMGKELCNYTSNDVAESMVTGLSRYLPGIGHLSAVEGTDQVQAAALLKMTAAVWWLSRRESEIVDDPERGAYLSDERIAAIIISSPESVDDAVEYVKRNKTCRYEELSHHLGLHRVLRAGDL